MALFKVCILFVNHNFKWPPPEDRVLAYDHIENDSLSSLPGERNHVYENLYLCRIHFFIAFTLFKIQRDQNWTYTQNAGFLFITLITTVFSLQSPYEFFCTCI